LFMTSQMRPIEPAKAPQKTRPPKMIPRLTSNTGYANAREYSPYFPRNLTRPMRWRLRKPARGKGWKTEGSKNQRRVFRGSSFFLLFSFFPVNDEYGNQSMGPLI